MKDCIFCKIINKETPAEIIYEDDYTLAFHDITPLATVHIIVIPKKCRLYFHETEDGILLHLFSAVKKIISLQNLEDQGYRLVNNNGINGRQSVNHMHIHLIGGELLGHNLAGK